jgi:hypothetical protein
MFLGDCFPNYKILRFQSFLKDGRLWKQIKHNIFMPNVCRDFGIWMGV